MTSPCLSADKASAAGPASCDTGQPVSPQRANAASAPSPPTAPTSRSGLASATVGTPSTAWRRKKSEKGWGGSCASAASDRPGGASHAPWNRRAATHRGAAAAAASLSPHAADRDCSACARWDARRAAVRRRASACILDRQDASGRGPSDLHISTSAARRGSDCASSAGEPAADCASQSDAAWVAARGGAVTTVSPTDSNDDSGGAPGAAGSPRSAVPTGSLAAATTGSTTAGS